ncbi:acyl-homoserine-lactone synthase [Aurantimonas sp. C2-3-R2]|uniref:acyl-homoserine-lactone synthase n=1 Tax=Aurantimonas sp. C2-3-R2 TaxID=3114363 RepID=UPI002E17C7F1|nr:acyl-homoserine-lactone synthase [Aurantimonas sp. C2-3-R2]
MERGGVAMFHIHIVDSSNRGAYRDELEQHFRLRHDIYVGERGWHNLARPDGREVDAFDTEDAVYLLGILPGKGVVAGSRLVPSVKPHLMSDVFPQLAPQSPFRNSLRRVQRPLGWSLRNDMIPDFRGFGRRVRFETHCGGFKGPSDGRSAMT